jgi:type IV secretion system protein VirB2
MNSACVSVTLLLEEVRLIKYCYIIRRKIMKFNLISSSLRKSFLVCLMACLFGFSMLPAMATATTTTTTQPTQIEQVLCRALGVIQGGVGRAIAALIIISLAVALFLGKVTWGVAIAVAAGIGLLFGAGGIVGALTGSTGGICAGVTGVTIN